MFLRGKKKRSISIAFRTKTILRKISPFLCKERHLFLRGACENTMRILFIGTHTPRAPGPEKNQETLAPRHPILGVVIAVHLGACAICFRPCVDYKGAMPPLEPATFHFFLRNCGQCWLLGQHIALPIVHEATWVLFAFWDF